MEIRSPMSQSDNDPSPHDSWLNERMRILLLAVAAEGGFIGLAYVIGWFTDTPPLLHFQWSALGALEGVAATLPLVVVFFVVMRWPVGPLARIKHFSERILRPMLRSCTLIDLLGISVLAGLGEEMFFRGAVQGSLQHYWVPFWVAVLISSVFFGLMHAVTPTYAILAAGISVYLGVVWYYTDNLLVVTIAHALYDFLALLYLMRGPGSLSEPEA
jgi:membrane protease YdiL (CAAX protease family)